MLCHAGRPRALPFPILRDFGYLICPIWVAIIKDGGISRYHFPNSFHSLLFQPGGGIVGIPGGGETPLVQGFYHHSSLLHYRKLRILRYNVQTPTYHAYLPIYLGTPIMNKGFSERVD